MRDERGYQAHQPRQRGRAHEAGTQGGKKNLLTAFQMRSPTQTQHGAQDVAIFVFIAKKNFSTLAKHLSVPFLFKKNFFLIGWNLGRIFFFEK
jgi:hypothetical protein